MKASAFLIPHTTMTIEPIAYFHSPFSSKFGVPKQSGLAKSLKGEIVFEPAYRNPDALRGIEGFDYLWLIWEFAANRHKASSPTVRPPLLGGNERMGVFATRSPFRPNAIGLSSVRLQSVDWHSAHGPVIHVSGADLMDMTPIYDIKPYIAYADSHPDARSGFVDSHPISRLRVVFSPEAVAATTESERMVLTEILQLDPRPHYQNSPDKVYGMPFEGRDIRFRVGEDTLEVVGIVSLP